MPIRWKSEASESAEAASLETYKTVNTGAGRVELRMFDPQHMDITSKHFLAIDGEVVAEFFKHPSGKGLARLKIHNSNSSEKVLAVLVDILSR